MATKLFPFGYGLLQKYANAINYFYFPKRHGQKITEENKNQRCRLLVGVAAPVKTYTLEGRTGRVCLGVVDLRVLVWWRNLRPGQVRGSYTMSVFCLPVEKADLCANTTEL